METEGHFEKLKNTVRRLLQESAEPTHAPTFLPTEPERPAIRSTDIAPGAVVINGVTLSQTVAEQLRTPGLPLAWYNASELRDAVESCAVDCTLIDDDEGQSFTDKLHLTAAEKQTRACVTRAVEPIRILASETFAVAEYGGSFTERLRAEKIRAFAQALAGPEVVAAH